MTPGAFHNRLAWHLRRRLEERGLTFTQAADEIGINRNAVFRATKPYHEGSYSGLSLPSYLPILDWLDLMPRDFSERHRVATVADVESAILALPDLDETARRMLAAAVRGAILAARRERSAA